jgi:hypothetical protein
MRAAVLGVPLFFLTLGGCGHGAAGSSIEPAAAQRLSDSFMADLVAHRTDAAYDKMEPKFTKMVHRSEFPPQLEKLLQYCGWPLSSELKQAGAGTKVYLDGHSNAIRKFTYAVPTSEYPKGGCYFSIDVVPNGDGLRVTTFGPLKSYLGQSVTVATDV